MHCWFVDLLLFFIGLSLIQRPLWALGEDVCSSSPLGCSIYCKAAWKTRHPIRGKVFLKKDSTRVRNEEDCMDTWWANIKTTDLQVNDIRVVDFWRSTVVRLPPTTCRSLTVGDNWDDGLYVEGGRLTAGADVFSSFQRKGVEKVFALGLYYRMVFWWSRESKTKLGNEEFFEKWTRERGVHANFL